MTTQELAWHREFADSESVMTQNLLNSFHTTAMPRLTHIEPVTDIATQMKGIDKYLHFDGRIVALEEKLDKFEDRRNICFEYASSPGLPGWSVKDQHSDILFYGFRHFREGYYFKTQELLNWYNNNIEYLKDNGYSLKQTYTEATVQPVPVTFVIKHVTSHRVTL